MSNFPLYNNLYKETIEKDLTTMQKKSFIKKIENIDQHGFELIYTLVKIYQTEHDICSNYILPYNGIYINNDISFNLDNLPNKLKRILYKFLQVHIKKMEEEEKLQKNRKK